jgi:hypothetical protein
MVFPPYPSHLQILNWVPYSAYYSGLRQLSRVTRSTYLLRTHESADQRVNLGLGTRMWQRPTN